MLFLMKCAERERERERESDKEANNLVFFFSSEQVIHTITGKQTNETMMHDPGPYVIILGLLYQILTL